MRPLVSYDDITAPQPTQKHGTDATSQPTAKKRKTSQNQWRGGQSQSHRFVQHWDDPGSQALQVNYDETSMVASSSRNLGAEAEHAEDEEYYEEDEEQSRELTHEEIWDDSALIDAWNSAAAEYEAFHGSDKSWKEEPVKKSPLWYNVPPTKLKSKPKTTASVSLNGTSTREASDALANGASDSSPLNFDTFVPTHDPSLIAANSLQAMPTMDASTSDMATVSQDEAFSRAMSAMYWSGYWTAIYHTRRNEAIGTNATEEAQEEQDGLEVDEMDDDDDEMLPAQR